MEIAEFNSYFSGAPGLVLGFHGCTEEIAKKVINRECDLTPSKNKYDWLGEGVYFWEANPLRAMEWARTVCKGEGAVVGALIRLGHCCNLLDSKCLKEISESYKFYMALCEAQNMQMAKNELPKSGADILLRNLDCAVINNLHSLREEKGLPAYDTVRGVFWEGKELYPNAGFREKNHIQLAVKNTSNILAYFSPLDVDSFVGPL